jgi:hypothetical protein
VAQHMAFETALFYQLVVAKIAFEFVVEVLMALEQFFGQTYFRALAALELCSLALQLKTL